MVVRKRKRAIAKAKKNLEIHEQNKIAHHAIDELINDYYNDSSIYLNTIISSLNEPVNSYKRYNIIDSSKLKTFRQSKLNDYKRYNIINEANIDLTIDEPLERKQFIDYEFELDKIGISNISLTLIPDLNVAKAYVDDCLAFKEQVTDSNYKPSHFETTTFYQYRGMFEIDTQRDVNHMSDIYEYFYTTLNAEQMYIKYMTTLESILVEGVDRYHNESLNEIVSIKERYESGDYTI